MPLAVKTLKWDEHNRADVYSISESYGQGPKSLILSRGSKIIGWYDDLETAKSMGQIDYETRVRAALDVEG